MAYEEFKEAIKRELLKLQKEEPIFFAFVIASEKKRDSKTGKRKGYVRGRWIGVIQDADVLFDLVEGINKIEKGVLKDSGFKKM